MAVAFAWSGVNRTELPTEANGRLIAAAPDLLTATEALRHLVLCMAQGPGWTQELLDEVIAAADSAIAKTKEKLQQP